MHPRKEALKTRIGSEGIEKGLGLEKRHVPISFIVSLFQPHHGLVELTEAEVNVRDRRRCDVARLS